MVQKGDRAALLSGLWGEGAESEGGEEVSLLNKRMMKERCWRERLVYFRWSAEEVESLGNVQLRNVQINGLKKLTLKEYAVKGKLEESEGKEKLRNVAGKVEGRERQKKLEEYDGKGKVDEREGKEILDKMWEGMKG
jgi:hypothetical protein